MDTLGFLNPLAFLFLAAVPLLILLYFLKLKRPQLEVSSTLLWQKVIEDMRVNSPFQRLRRSLLLLVQLLLLLLFIFALTRPLTKGRDRRQSSVIVLLDNSASMAAIEPDGRSRFALAIAELQKMVDHLPQNSELMVITFNTTAREVCGFSNNRRLLKETIRKLEPTDCPTDITQALTIARSLANTRQTPRLVLFSDGAFPDPGRLELPVKVEYQRIGTPLANLAITGLDMRRPLKDRQRLEMFVSIHNFGTETTTGTMTVYLDDRVLDTKLVKVEAARNLAQILEADMPGGGVVRVELDSKDALAADNHAWQVVPPPVQRRVLLVGDNLFFVKRAFQAAPDIAVTSVAPGAANLAGAEEYSAVIWCNVPQPGLAPTNNLYLGCAPTLPEVSLGEPLPEPAVMDWDSAHPVTRFLDFSNLIIAETRMLKVPTNASVVVRSLKTPLVVVGEHNQGYYGVVGFDIFRSNWPLLVSFPLFLHNCLDYFDQQRLRRQRSNITVGQTITVSRQAQTPHLVLPDGREVEMSPTTAGDFSFAATERCGIYRVKPGKDLEDLNIAANLFRESESRLEPNDQPISDPKAAEPTNVARQMTKEYARYLLAGAALLLLAEWVVYHRRILT